MEVRKADPEDADEACGIVRRSIAELCRADHQDDNATISGWLGNKTPDNFRRWVAQTFVCVAIEQDRIIGVGAMTAAGEITLNYVSPDARFRGVSKALLQCLERNAIGLGLEALTLQSTLTALPFYGSAGFRMAGPPTKGFGVTFGHPMIKRL